MISKTEGILQSIVSSRKRAIAQQKSKMPEGTIERLARHFSELPRKFLRRLKAGYQKKSPAIIAEIKRASPSKGMIKENFDPQAIAKSYEEGGATCISVLTETEFFLGSPNYIKSVKAACSLPVLRKDFILDDYQIFESKLIGSDCILLIAAILDISDLHRLYKLAISLDLDVLVEVHNSEELDKVLTLAPSMIGINNRNLNSFEVNLDVTIDLVEKIPSDVLLVTESGIKTRVHIEKMLSHGIYGFLIGEALMANADPGLALSQLTSF